jgi:hypothetical protein
MEILTLVQPQPPRARVRLVGQSEDLICWSRMQAEAGQQLHAIIERKERERQAGNGLFLWGVGNAPPVHIRVLARIGTAVPVIFSVMKVKPKAIDATPTRTLAWRRYIDSNGAERLLPLGALVTSRGHSVRGAEKERHYALMCHSGTPLRLAHGVPFDPAAYRNASGTGARVGASQVTALLRRVEEPDHNTAYQANIVARLAGSYWVRLTDPVQLDAAAVKAVADFHGDQQHWVHLIREALSGAVPVYADAETQVLLL